MSNIKPILLYFSIIKIEEFIYDEEIYYDDDTTLFVK